MQKLVKSNVTHLYSKVVFCGFAAWKIQISFLFLNTFAASYFCLSARLPILVYPGTQTRRNKSIKGEPGAFHGKRLNISATAII